MQVARTNRWSALGSVGGLIASGIGANWAAMAISAAAAGPIILTLTPACSWAASYSWP